MDLFCVLVMVSRNGVTTCNVPHGLLQMLGESLLQLDDYMDVRYSILKCLKVAAHRRVAV